jgi:hypothetical protein
MAHGFQNRRPADFIAQRNASEDSVTASGKLKSACTLCSRKQPQDMIEFVWTALLPPLTGGVKVESTDIMTGRKSDHLGHWFLQCKSCFQGISSSLYVIVCARM